MEDSIISKMNTEIAKIKFPEEIELEELIIELHRLENLLTNKELELSTLSFKVSIFETKYLQIVGKKLCELDTLVAQLLSLLASRNPNNIKYQQSAQKAQQRAYESSQASENASKKENVPDKFEPSEDLKKLYHEVAKRIHPDFSSDEQERALREEIMKEVNQAFSSGDVEKLQNILSSLESSYDYQSKKGVEKQIEIIKTKVSRIRSRIEDIDIEITHLLKSDLYQLKLQVEEAEFQGIDLLGRMTSQVVSRIKKIEQQLFSIIQEHYEWGGLDV